MKISMIELIEKKDVTSVQARVTWENTERDDMHFFVETNRNTDNGFWPDPNAFLLAAYIPA